jgi:hypothetical protein
MVGRVFWTQTFVEHILGAAMNPEPAPTKAANLPLGKLLPQPKGKLKDQFHEVARVRHLSPRTEGAYWEWVVRYLKFHRDRAGGWQHPRDLGGKGVSPFLTYLATACDVSASTQIYTHVMAKPGIGVRSPLDV